MQAIFSDDSDDEGGDSGIGRVDNQDKKAEVANTALSRLIAGDFLESLGKELGIEVPPDMPYPTQKSKNIAAKKQLVNQDTRTDVLDSQNNNEISLNHDQHIAHEGGVSKGDTIHGNKRDSTNVKTKGTSTMNYKPDKSDGDNIKDVSKIKSPLVRSQDHSSSSEEESRKRSSREKYDEYRKVKTPVTHRRDYSSSSSFEEEKSRKRSRHHRHRRRDAGSDSSSDDERRDRHSSRSKGRRKGSSREKGRSEKHSKHHKHRKHPNRHSRHSNEKDSSHSRNEKRRRE